MYDHRVLAGVPGRRVHVEVNFQSLVLLINSFLHSFSIPELLSHNDYPIASAITRQSALCDHEARQGLYQSEQRRHNACRSMMSRQK